LDDASLLGGKEFTPRLSFFIRNHILLTDARQRRAFERATRHTIFPRVLIKSKEHFPA
jgi:hypothetical protein